MENEINEIEDQIQAANTQLEAGRNNNVNVLRRHIKDNPEKALLARHRLWMNSVQHEYPMPYMRFRIGVYIRYYNQTKYSNYIEKHKQQFIDDIAMCPMWTLVDFYIDKGMTAPRMENSKEWCRLLDDCLSGKVDLIVTQKVSSVSSDPEEITFIARVLAAQKKPVGIYFISEDIYTLASYYLQDLRRGNLLPEGWEPLPEDDLDRILLRGGANILMLEDTNARSEDDDASPERGN